MYTLFLSAIINGQLVSNNIDGVTFNSKKQCLSYIKKMQYEQHNPNSKLKFECKKLKVNL